MALLKILGLEKGSSVPMTICIYHLSRTGVLARVLAELQEGLPKVGPFFLEELASRFFAVGLAHLSLLI